MADKATDKGNTVVRSAGLFLKHAGALISDSAEEIEEIVTGSTLQRRAEAHYTDKTSRPGSVRV